MYNRIELYKPKRVFNENILTMKRNLIYLVNIVLSATISCAPVQKETQQQSNPQQLNQMQISRLKQDAAVLSSPGSQTAAAPVQSSEPVRLNPPHGQPGHICEIPVGSPLPSTPVRTNANSAAVSASPQNRNNAANAPTASNTVRLNPPHGEPGHICEIPVGSPLP